VIVAKPKPFDEILGMMNGFQRVLVAGCGTCVAVCLTGGEKEAGLLATKLKLAMRSRGSAVETSAATVERQCDREFLRLFAEHVEQVDAVVSLACGAGIQFLGRDVSRYAGLSRRGHEFHRRGRGRGRLDRAMQVL